MLFPVNERRSNQAATKALLTIVQCTSFIHISCSFTALLYSLLQ
ncbi:unnamed protein product [Brugia timori]|uniref:Uncharacterized protein n=1 Tax=Brugia timori TaxID=42155 RepID=A0A3P7UFK9_9BILA|nr:unnamed protein product [Brugia timori]